MSFTAQINIFIVDDNKVFSMALKGAIETAFKNSPIEINMFETGEKCLDSLAKIQPELIILDYNLNSLFPEAANGLEVLNAIKQNNFSTNVIMLTSNDHIDIALKSFQHGVADYVIKTPGQFEKITLALSRIFDRRELARLNEEKEKLAIEQLIADKRACFQNEENEKRVAELITNNKELKFQNREKKKWAAELDVANRELSLEKKEKEKLTEELLFINLQMTEVERSKLAIEEKNKEITDSLNYARRIQQAKLPKKEDIYSALGGCFILFKPKDIVSGDFYSFHKSDQGLFIAAADCTGHGVPGAFMSMIGSEKLTEAISYSSDTSEILTYLNKGIKRSLQQSESSESTRDGMDIAICSIDPVSRVVKYAGANRPLWIIRKGQTELEEIKATKMAIGGLTEDGQHFNSHEFKFETGDTFYIFTDGYADQFGGPHGKKLMVKKFKQILVDIQKRSMPEQKKLLNNFLKYWKDGKEQVDDILVIGIRL
ncbi:MAG: SpoIIE family protein phosphatase [Bacteroidia bacterium]